MFGSDIMTTCTRSGRLASKRVRIAAQIAVALLASSSFKSSFFSDAFVSPTVRAERPAFSASCARINALPPQFADWCGHFGDASPPLSSLTSSFPSFFYLASVEGVVDVGSDVVQPFTDDISFLDGPILGMVGGAVAVMVLLVGFKALMGKMDEAIGNVLVEFEQTMKTAYPQRWEEMEAELEELQGVDRDVKLYELMDRMQKENPTFMSRVKERMTRR